MNKLPKVIGKPGDRVERVLSTALNRKFYMISWFPTIG